ncbi:hypothetical protein NQ315_007900 [Exocentrus adspersus]|uniref:Protein stoned-A n=1 Tax=Exocentrus adspersus TaxID=1586481 RepID=A0AAV8W9Y0_9CUCU|nr:hypothetical protein NQ315_007900 [Exocentrus adspersus]
MHKITKGLKKKKKGKKSKHKEEDLFKPEELEEYRKEHQAGTSEESAVKNEEWKKFIALTSGVDDILKKTQGDLDRIKSTSFFQRKPTESEVQKRTEEVKAAQEAKQALNKEVGKEAPAQLGIVEVSESESEEEDDDNIFDTAYIDAIAAGEVKLAYIPESPSDKQDGDDPFDTTIADRAILGPEVERKGRKLVPIGAAVEVLTGRVQLPTCATQRPISKRQILKERDLLLGSFDDSLNLPKETSVYSEEVPRTLLDDDSVPLPDKPIDLNAPPPVQIITNVASTVVTQENIIPSKDIIDEFDVIDKAIDDPDDIEFEVLAAESLSKSAKAIESLPSNTSGPLADVTWNAFEQNETTNIEVDPFDTTFAENILPGKVELKILEKEILSEDIDFNIRDDSFRLDVQISRSANPVKGTGVEKRIPESELNLIKPEHRDLLGGSNTDLSVINPSTQVRFNQGQSSDIFDAAVVNQVSNSDNAVFDQKICDDVLSDDDFDPRAEEKPRERTVSRPDVLNIANTKTVSFDLTSPKQSDLLGVGESGSKILKPLTPFYVRKSSVPELPIEEEISDPFDTSFASNITPGKAELKIIESELFDPNIEKQLSLVDNDFDPRDEKKAERDKVVGIIKDITNVKLPDTKIEETIDLLATDDEISTKVLTPGGFVTQIPEEISYCDPFDTSTIATNILPGKTELKLLETELIQSGTVPNIDKPIQDLLEEHHDIISHQPLFPSAECGEAVTDEQPDFDPFDTKVYHSPPSAASNPFLLNDDDIQNASDFGDNPFLSSDPFPSSTNATNPFAFEPNVTEQQSDNKFNVNCDDKSSVQDLFATNDVTVLDKTPALDILVNPDPVVAPPQKPQDLNLKCSPPAVGNLPPRPPPPRPPPSKETQDLLMSVMGAMDATSSSLLDKIPPTRTPSPVSMRDLHSPSPTPETGDLLDVGDRATEIVANNKSEDFLKMDLEINCDINQNPEVIQKVQQPKPVRPAPPTRPPKPPPPQKPPPA